MKNANFKQQDQNLALWTWACERLLAGTAASLGICQTMIQIVESSVPLRIICFVGAFVLWQRSAIDIRAGTLPPVGFVSARTITPGDSVALGDFNGDGKLDLAVVYRPPYDSLSGRGTNSALSILLNDGTGDFHAASTYNAGETPVTVAVGDFDGDGKPDVVVANVGGISVFWGKGDGSFEVGGPVTISTFQYQSPDCLVVGDFNRDGKADLAIGGLGTVWVLLGNDRGMFQPAWSIAAGSGSQSLAVEDVNGDRNLDLVILSSGSSDPASGLIKGGGVSVLLGRGDGTFESGHSYPLQDYPQAVAVGDLNGDGKPDLAIANNGYVSLLISQGNGEFRPTVNYAAGVGGTSSWPTSTTIGDCTGDGLNDLIVTDLFGGISILIGRGDGTFKDAVSYLTGPSPRQVALADFNGDGYIDLVVAHYLGGPDRCLLQHV
jgi:hypothetical protein